MTETTTGDWVAANRRFVQTELARLRLVLHRRVLWLRHQWKHDPLQPYQGLVISDAQADALLAEEDRAAETRFYQKDGEARSIDRAMRQVEQQLDDQLQAFLAEGKPPALDVMVHLFGLGQFERFVLLLCLASHLDPTFERLYAYIQDDVNRRYATLNLARMLWGDRDPSAHRERFRDDGALRRFNLVTLEAGGSATSPSARPLRLDDRVADYLLGVNRLDERLTPLLRPMPPSQVSPEHAELVDGLYRWLERPRPDGQAPLLNLIGPPGVGKSTVARALCRRMGLRPSQLVTVAPAPALERLETVRAIEREALLSQLGIYVDVTAPRTSEQPSNGNWIEALVDTPIFLMIGSEEPVSLRGRAFPVRVPKLGRSAQVELWRQALGPSATALDGQVDAIAQQFDLGPGAITRTVRMAHEGTRLRSHAETETVAPEELWQACREQSSGRLEALAQRLTPCHSWSDIVVSEDTERQLREIAGQIARRSTVYEAWGFGARLNRGRGISALFSGPSGTGKTMAAEILANHVNLDLFRIDLAGVVSKYIGETEKNLRALFDAAERSGAILFFDEADALFGKRSEVKDSHDRYANIEISYLLQRMEEYPGLAILATNQKAHLDQAFLRRLRFLVDFPFPDAAHRRRIWQQVFPPEAVLEALDWNALARLEIPGGNIKNIALNAAFLAADDCGSIRMEHVRHAARREFAKIDKLMPEYVGDSLTAGQR